MENWSYYRKGAVAGPVNKAELEALYGEGEITRQTLVRSTSAGGEWKRYGEVAGLAPPRIPQAVRRFWPWFMLGTPLVAGLIDALLIRSTGNQFVEANASWLSHVPTALNILAAAVWLLLITIEIQKRAKGKKITAMAVWLIATPLFLTFSWWTTILVSFLINVPFGHRLPDCQADITKFELKQAFEKAKAKPGEAGASVGVITLTDPQQQGPAGRIRMCTGKLVTPDGQTYSVRYGIDDHGNRLILRRMHSFYVTLVIQ